MFGSEATSSLLLNVDGCMCGNSIPPSAAQHMMGACIRVFCLHLLHTVGGSADKCPFFYRAQCVRLVSQEHGLDTMMDDMRALKTSQMAPPGGAQQKRS